MSTYSEAVQPHKSRVVAEESGQSLGSCECGDGVILSTVSTEVEK